MRLLCSGMCSATMAGSFGRQRGTRGIVPPRSGNSGAAIATTHFIRPALNSKIVSIATRGRRQSRDLDSVAGSRDARQPSSGTV